MKHIRQSKDWPLPTAPDSRAARSTQLGLEWNFGRRADIFPKKFVAKIVLRYFK